MLYYNEPTTAEQFEFILARDTEQRKGQASSVGYHEIISIPSGQHYGKDGHIPCDHYVSFGMRSVWNDLTDIRYRTFGTKCKGWVNGHAVQFGNSVSPSI